MPRAWASARATGDAGGAAGGKERSTDAQTNNYEGPRMGPLKAVQKDAVTSHAVTEVRNFTFSLQRFQLDSPL
jgi:hypothetical protein